MSKSSAGIDLSINPRAEIGERVMNIATSLLEPVKRAPQNLRTEFPPILRNNNFGWTTRVTKKYIFLDISGKVQAQRSKDIDRLTSYRRVFTSAEQGEPAIFKIDEARMCRFSDLSTEGAYSFSLGKDFSFAAWNLRNKNTEGGREILTDIDLIYVIGFGRVIHEDIAWQELDTLVRLTIADWSSNK